MGFTLRETLVAANFHSVNVSQAMFYTILEIGFGAAFVLYLYDWFLTLADEIRYIWGGWKLHWRSKALFLVMRYLALAMHLIRVTWAFHVLNEFPAPMGWCRKYSLVQVLPPTIQTSAVDFILVLRVWVLFNRNKRSMYFISFLYFAQVCVVTILFSQIVHDITWDALCVIRIPTYVQTCMAMAIIIFQTFMWAFTMIQCRKALSRSKARRSLIILLMRDGTFVWLALSGLYTLSIICNNRISNSLSIMLCPWVTTAMSIAGCRMIINMQQLAEAKGLFGNELSESSSMAIELTTVFALYDE